MRPIEFRAWDIKNKEMHQVTELEFKDGQIVSLGVVGGEGELFDAGYWEIMQYSGLDDQAEVKMFEGDILEQWVEGTRFVWKMFFDRGRAQFGMESTSDAPNDFPSEVVIKTSKNGKPKIIGNIYENPKLLK